MIFDSALMTAGYKNHLCYARRHGLLNRILDQRLIHHGHHFLGARLGGGEETGAHPCHGENRFSYSGHERTRLVLEFRENQRESTL